MHVGENSQIVNIFKNLVEDFRVVMGFFKSFFSFFFLYTRMIWFMFVFWGLGLSLGDVGKRRKFLEFG